MEEQKWENSQRGFAGSDTERETDVKSVRNATVDVPHPWTTGSKSRRSLYSPINPHFPSPRGWIAARRALGWGRTGFGSRFSRGSPARVPGAPWSPPGAVAGRGQQGAALECECAPSAGPTRGGLGALPPLGKSMTQNREKSRFPHPRTGCSAVEGLGQRRAGCSHREGCARFIGKGWNIQPRDTVRKNEPKLVCFHRFGGSKAQSEAPSAHSRILRQFR